MNEEMYYGIQGNTILLLCQIAVLLNLIDRMATQSELKVDGKTPKEWFQVEMRPALRAHIDRMRKVDPHGADIVERQLFRAGKFN